MNAGQGEDEGLQMRPLNGDVETVMVQSNVSERRRKLPQYLAAIIVNLAAFTYGMVVAWTSSALLQLRSKNTPLEEGPISADQASWLGSIVCLGAVVGVPIYSFLAQQFGRKTAGYFVAVPFIFGWLLIYIAKSYGVLLLARSVIGIASGGMMIVCPLYLSETAEDSIRGSLGSYFLLFMNAGILLPYIVGPVVPFHTLAIICFIFPVLYFILFIWMPESPLYYSSKGKMADAARSLHWLRGGDKQVIDKELAVLKRSVQESSEMPASIKDFCSSSGTRRALLIGVMLAINQQFSGIFPIQSYAEEIFKLAESGLSSHMSTVVLGILQLVASYTCSLLVDRAGRTILLIISDALMTLCLAALGLYFYLKSSGAETGALWWLPVSSLSVYVIAFSIGVGPLPFVVISEIFSPKVRGLATWICFSTVWISAFVVAKYFHVIAEVFGVHVCFWFFSACCLSGMLCIKIFLPETKNKSIDVILKELNSKQSSASIQET